MPDWLVWLLRAVVLLGLPGVMGFASFQLLGAGQPLILAAFVAFALVISVLGIGAHVAHSNEQVDALKAAVVSAAGGAAGLVRVASSAALDEAMREVDAATTRTRQPEG